MPEQTPLEIPVKTNLQGVFGIPGHPLETYAFADGRYARICQYGGNDPAEDYVGTVSPTEQSILDICAAERARVISLARVAAHLSGGNVVQRLECLRILRVPPVVPAHAVLWVSYD